MITGVLKHVLNNQRNKLADCSGRRSSCQLLLVILLIFFQFATITFLQAESPAAGNSAEGITVDKLELGFQELVKPGYWSPIHLEISGLKPNENTKHALWIISDDDQNDIVEQKICELKLQEKTGKYTGDGWFLYGHPNSRIQVCIKSDDEKQEVIWKKSLYELAIKLVLMRPENRLILVSGSHEQINKNNLSNLVPDGITLTYEEGNLPIDPLAKAAVAAYVFIGSEGYKVASEKGAVLEKHVKAGGHVLFCEAINPEDFKKSQLATWIPVTIDKTLSIKNLGAFQNFTEHSTPLWSDSPLSVSVFSNYEKKLIHTLDGVHACRNSIGFGFVTMLGLDISKTPLNNWNSLPLFASKLLDTSPPKSRAVVNNETSRSLSHTGMTEFKSQIQAALQDVFKPRELSLFQIFGTFLLAILVIGPFDYYLCQKWFKRPYLTWFSMPVLGVMIAILQMGITENKTAAIKGNQLTVLDYDMQSNTLRMHHQSAFYSEDAQQVDVNIGSTESELSALKKPVRFNSQRAGWSGEQEDTFGGIRRIPSSSHDTGTYISQLVNDGKAMELNLDSVPMRKRSCREIQWQAIAELGETALTAEELEQQSFVQADLNGTLNGQLVGYLVNNSQYPLKNWVITFGRRIYFPIDQEEKSVIPVKGRIKVDDDRKMRSRDLVGYITNESTTQVKKKSGLGEEIVIQQAEYDLRNRDLDYLIYRLSFYNILGGLEYTSLFNQELIHLDMSNKLEFDYALLIAEYDCKDLMPIRINDEKLDVNEKVFLRVLIPVTRIGSRNTRNQTVPLQDKYKIPENQNPVLPQLPKN